MESVRNPWSDSVLAGFATLACMPTLLALVAAAACWMAWERRWRTLVSWLSAVAFSEIVVLAIQFTIHRVPPGSLSTFTYIVASNHVPASVVVYGFIGFFITRRVGVPAGFFAATTCAVIVAAAALAGLYFGRFWFSDALVGAMLALTWVALIGIIAVWHNPSVAASRGFMPAVFLLVAVCSVGLQLDTDPPREPDARSTSKVVVLSTEGQWPNSLWMRLPCYRADMAGERLDPFAVRWAGGREDITRRLSAMGWVDGPGLSTRSVLSLAVPDATAMELPALPRLNNGVPSTLMFIRTGGTPEERYVLRFWRSGYAIAGDKGEVATPVWIGSLVHERLRTSSWPFNILHADAIGWSKTNVQLLRVAAGTSVLPSVECSGIPLMLRAPTRG